MSFVPIKKIQKRDPATGEMIELYAVPSVSIATPQGRKLIPNPSGNEANLFNTLAEAEEAIRRAGFDYEFEGKKTYLLGQAAAAGQSKARYNASSVDQAVPLLLDMLQAREASVVANAAYALGALKAFGAIDPLAEHLGHDDPSVRKTVAEALAKFGMPALPRLHDAFEQARASSHKNAPYIRLTVMLCFLEMLDQGLGLPLRDQFLPLAVTALADESWLVKSQAALVVGRTAQMLDEERKKAEQQRRGPSS
ncbi:MAG: hypothetical protein K0Q50_515 [Vampirovibrio sp.]|jgi:hypothetical protein|nr:hypothetical protein [Vampirovibrio sp.]